MPEAKVVVPPLTDLRKVPALSKRLAPEFRVNEAEFCTSNNAPGRLVITPVVNRMLCEPVQVAVPPFSRVRAPKVTLLLLSILRTAPEGMTVRPPPLIVPPVQFSWVKAVTTLLPPSVPPLK